MKLILLRIRLSRVVQRVKIELDVVRRSGESRFNEHARDRTLIEDNPCSG
jgi:hypothetical protein